MISGQHTESGFPLHANDFHSGRDLPARMTISEMTWGEHSVHGGQLAGIPGVISGRSKNFSWSMTVALGDSTDLWEEELNEDKTKYKVDGEWRDIKREKIMFYPMGEEPEEYDLLSTHRGALFTYKQL